MGGSTMSSRTSTDWSRLTSAKRRVGGCGDSDGAGDGDGGGGDGGGGNGGGGDSDSSGGDGGKRTSMLRL